MVEFESAIKTLTENKVDFVIVGGVAISVYSSGYITKDLDFCYLRTSENLKKIVLSFNHLNPLLRGFPEDLPFFWDEKTLANGTNFTLLTDIGDIDLLGEVAGVGTFKEAFENSIIIELFGCNVHVLCLEDLIKAKRAAGRTKDLLVLPELEALREMLKETE